MIETDRQILDAELLQRVDVESHIRPITTTGYHKQYQASPYDFPKLYQVPETFPVRMYDPVSSYTIDRNTRFEERYANFITKH